MFCIVNLPQEILEMIFIKLPPDYLEILYYDEMNKCYWMNFSVRLSNTFWINKTCYDYSVTENEFNDSNLKGYYRYAEILSRTDICKYSLKPINIRLFLLRAAKNDYLDLFVKGLKYLFYPIFILNDMTDIFIDITGMNVMKYCIDRCLIKVEDQLKYILNPNEGSVQIIRGKNTLDDIDMLGIKLA